MKPVSPDEKGHSLNNLPLQWAETWSLSDLEFELRRRGMAWAILGDTVTEYQRKKIAAVIIEADSQVTELLTELQRLVYDCREVSGLLGMAERKQVIQPGAGDRFMASIERAEAAIRAAKTGISDDQN